MRYITHEGVEASLGSDADCAAAIRSGVLTARSLVHEESSGRWVKAREHGYLSAFFPAAAWTAAALSFAAVIAWVIGLLDPPLIATLQGRDVLFAAEEAVAIAVVLGLVGASARLLVKTPSSRTILALMLGLLLCLSEFPLLKWQGERGRLHASAQNLQNALAAASSAGGAVSQSASSYTGTPAPRAGYVGPSLLDAIADLIQDDNRLLAQYKSAYAALHAETLLIPETLASGAQLRAASGRLDDWMTYLDSYEGDQARIKERFESRVASLSLSDSVRASFIRSYDEGKKRTEPNTQRFLEIERSVNSEIRGMYTFMGKHTRSVRLRNGKLFFASSTDVKAYNAHLKRIRALAAEESKIQSELLQMRSDGMAKLQEVARSAAAQ